MTGHKQVQRSATRDEDLSLYQLHCRYAIRWGADMAMAAELWNEMKGRYSSPEAHISALSNHFCLSTESPDQQDTVSPSIELADGKKMARVYEMQNAPIVAEYVRGLTLIRSKISEMHLRLFRAHYTVENRTATAKQLAALAEIKGGWTVVNSLYGKLGHALCDELGIEPELRPDFTHRWWSIWSRGWNTHAGFVWQMLPQVAEALEQLGWVSPGGFVSPDEVLSAEALVEGAVCRVTVNAYERNPEARRRCIEAHGTSCCICGFSFGNMYGAAADGYIHIHHIRPLSEVRSEYVVDPIEDLRPVCPNCHVVLHLGGHGRTIEEVRQLLTRPKR